MKLTESVLRRIIKEELEAVLSEVEKEEEETDHAAEMKARVKKSQEERGVTGKSDRGAEYLKRLKNAASK